MAKRWPISKKSYLDYFCSYGLRLGDICYCQLDYNKTLIHIAAYQDAKPGLQIDYNGMQLGLARTALLVRDLETCRTGSCEDRIGVALSRIGCDLGSADWTEMRSIFSKTESYFPFIEFNVWC